MEIRDGYEDARECAARCLTAMSDCTDVEDRRSLWKAAVRYAGLARMKRGTTLEVSAVPLPRSRGSIARGLD